MRKAYRRLAQQYHPDRNPDPDANEKFSKINVGNHISSQFYSL